MDKYEIKNSINDYIKNQKSKNGIILFYMDGCGHCDRLKPVLLHMKKLPENQFFLGAVNSNKHPELSKQYVSEGYPTMYFVKDGKMEDHSFDVDRSEQKHALGHLLEKMVNETNSKPLCEYRKDQQKIVKL